MLIDLCNPILPGLYFEAIHIFDTQVIVFIWSTRMKYRKRVPKVLESFVDKTEIIKTISSQQEKITLDIKLQNAVLIAKSDYSIQTKTVMIQEELRDIVFVKESDVGVRYFEAVKMYLEQSKVSKREYQNREYFFNDLFPSLLQYIFEENPKTVDITSLHLNKIANIIQKLPSRNHEDLKRISSSELIIKAVKGDYDSYTKLNIETVNKLIKRIRSFAFYGYRTGLFEMKSAVGTIKHQYSAREQRQALSHEEVEVLLNNTRIKELQDFILLLYYTGMRLSELRQFSTIDVEGIECFDLRDAESLKTMSSYRVIPRHPKIKNIKFSYTLEHLSRMTKKLIDQYLLDTTRKTTYSLRHSFASELIKRGVSTDIVSELMGHAHTTMTMNRYVKGYPIKLLNEAINCL